MMEWTLAILLGSAGILLLLSIVKTKQASNEEKREIDLVHIALTNELDQVRQHIRNIELDVEITAKEAGIHTSPTGRTLKREILDLYRRGYSIENISAEKKLTPNEVNQLLAPYLTSKDERRKVAQ
ncbi:hypothetical protein [Litchfieldia alkalitelluris]|uniref:hypothetical protein n=1 Tax=Litchfieldia alkalitelluris TaxID=304268 RepID=UPI001F17F1A1|nr:hypothetical protein [Litchfieldia alkalitelluris]